MRRPCATTARRSHLRTVICVNVLLLSNSTNHGDTFLRHARTAIEEVAQGSQVVFLPYALADWDSYAMKVQRALGLGVISAHTSADPAVMINDAQCLLVGGGNTFRLLDTLYSLGVMSTIRERVFLGKCAYIGTSAGTNVACPTIRTTNDMPITEPPSLSALGLVPFQINPHYVDADPASTLMAETRDDRLEQFHEISSVPVVALYEGAWVRVQGVTASIGGQRGGWLLEPGARSRLVPGDDISQLLRPRGGFDDCGVPRRV